MTVVSDTVPSIQTINSKKLPITIYNVHPFLDFHSLAVYNKVNKFHITQFFDCIRVQIAKKLYDDDTGMLSQFRNHDVYLYSRIELCQNIISIYQVSFQ